MSAPEEVSTRVDTVLADVVAKAITLVAKEIVERDGKWCVVSATTGRSFGCYDSKQEAHRRLGQVESYKSRILKKDDAERFVFGVVLVPEDVDSQGDVYDAATIRKAAHGFMARYAEAKEKRTSLGEQHKERLLDGEAVVLESYVSKVAEQYGDETFPEGTWFLGVRVVDDDLWTRVEEGKLNGFSIGGSAVKEPLEPPPEEVPPA